MGPPLPKSLSPPPPHPLRPLSLTFPRLRARSWFNGNQTAVWTSTNSSSSNAFCINVHGTSSIIVGDVSIPSNSPVDIEWFCDGFSSFIGVGA